MPPVPHQAEFDQLQIRVTTLETSLETFKTSTTVALAALRKDLTDLAQREDASSAQFASAIAALEARVTALESTSTPQPVDCVLSEWSEWSAWSDNGDGTESRTRTRTVVTEPQHGGAACGALTETETRPIAPTPVNCVLGEEEIISETPTEACRSDGTQQVQVIWERPVIVPPQHGGEPCGPTSGSRYEMRPCIYVPPTPGGDPHAYFNTVKGRSDCFVSYGLRDAAEVARYAPSNPPELQVFYDYANDPDPRKQDAMKIVMKDGSCGVYGTFQAPIGPSMGANVFFTMDAWFGNEYRHDYSKLHTFKETPFSIVSAGVWVAIRVSFIQALQDYATQPPGGPYIGFVHPQAYAKAGIVKNPDTWMSGQAGFPPMEFGSRRYNECISPMEAEFGIVGNRFTRFFLFFERRSTEDWVSTHTNFLGKTMMAYAYSLWCADTERDAVCILNERIVGMPTDWTKHIQAARFTYQDGNAALADMWLGRGDVVSYQRNWVSLHGTSKQDVVTNLLKKPIT